MSEPNSTPDLEPARKTELPPVEPPSAGFLIQLFVIPMMIVLIIVLVWLMFSWLAHMGSNPRELVRDLKRLNEASWQRALTLADLLRNPDYDELKRDPELAAELAQILEDQLDAGRRDAESVKLRVFLCRALGEFHVPSEVLPVLLKAATHEEDLTDIDVRRTALEALAILGTNNSTRELQANDELMQALLGASRERTQNSEERPLRAELRSTATYVLGVLGGQQSLDRLEVLMDDAYANVRYNAALGLARYGDIRSQRVLLEMLDPMNEQSAQSEQHEAGKLSKRLLVIKNGIRGAKQLAEQNQEDELSQLSRALETILESDLHMFNSRVRGGIRINAEDALIELRSRSMDSQ